MKDSKKGLCKQSDCERADVASLTDALRAINTFTFFYSTPVGATPPAEPASARNSCLYRTADHTQNLAPDTR